MLKSWLIIFSTIIFFGCQNRKNTEFPDVKSKKDDISFNDSLFVENPQFKKGDIRRYGIFPNQPISQEKLKKILNLAQNGLKIKIPQGIYNTNLVIEGLKDISISCDDVVITGALQITDLNNNRSSNISIKGSITILDKVFIRKSSNLYFDTLVVKTDTAQNMYKKMNRGVSIYAGSNNVNFKNLEISGTGGNEDEFYKYTAAALQVHGWDNNPEFITIDKLVVKNVQRTAVYLTGNGHLIKKAIVINYAQHGKKTNMFGLDDAKPGSEKEFSGVWLNKCNNCDIDSLEISNNFQKPYSLKLGIGIYSEPAVINNLSLKGKAKQAPIEDNLLTNVLVKHEY